MFIARTRIEAPALRQECDVYLRQWGFVLRQPNMALLTECGTLSFRGL
jgi:hypothetical protein